MFSVQLLSTADCANSDITLFLRVLLYHNFKVLSRSLLGLNNAVGKKNRKVQEVMHLYVTIT